MATRARDEERVAELQQGFGVDEPRARKMAELEQGEIRADVDGLDYESSHVDEVAGWADQQP